MKVMVDFKSIREMATNLHAIARWVRDEPISRQNKSHIKNSIWAIFCELETLWSELVLDAEPLTLVHYDKVMLAQRELVELNFFLKKGEK